MAASIPPQLAAALAPVAALQQSALGAYEALLGSAAFTGAVSGPADRMLAPFHGAADLLVKVAYLDPCLARYLLSGVLLCPLLAAATRLLPSRGARDAWLAAWGAMTCYYVFGRAWESLLLVALACFGVLQLRALPQRHLAAVALASGYLVQRKWTQASSASSEGMDDSVLHVVFGEGGPESAAGGPAPPPPPSAPAPRLLPRPPSLPSHDRAHARAHRRARPLPPTV